MRHASIHLFGLVCTSDVHTVSGVIGEYFIVKDAKSNLVPIPDDLSDEQALYMSLNLKI